MASNETPPNAPLSQKNLLPVKAKIYDGETDFLRLRSEFQDHEISLYKDLVKAHKNIKNRHDTDEICTEKNALALLSTRWTGYEELKTGEDWSIRTYEVEIEEIQRHTKDLLKSWATAKTGSTASRNAFLENRKHDLEDIKGKIKWEDIESKANRVDALNEELVQLRASKK